MTAPLALFGIDNSGFGIAANLLVIFMIALWLALVYWALADARRRLEDPVLIGSAALAALIFPFAGALVYAIVRPPETMEDAYERDLDLRAAELRVRLLEQALKSGSGSTAFDSAVSSELSGEPAKRPGGDDSGSPRRAAEPRDTGKPPSQTTRSSSPPSRPATPAAAPRDPAPGAPSRPSQSPPRPSVGRPLRRPPGPDAA
jgi:hypothetical protein